VGGLVGSNGATVSNSFYDATVSGKSDNTKGTPKTTDNMKLVQTFTDNTWSTGLTSPWDFVGNPYYDENNKNIWNIHPLVNGGYPFLTSLLSIPPNKPTDLLPSARQTSTSVSISCVVTDNDSLMINVHFYDNADNSLVDNIWADNGTTASVVWDGLTRGQTYTFFARSLDNMGTWGENSDTQTFYINSLPTVENLKTGGQVNPVGLVTFTPSFSWTYSDNDNDNQSDYQIQVGTSENGNNMWDNTDAALTQITYSGNALSRGVTYHVRVRVKDNYEWGPWVSGTFELSASPTVTVGSSTIELRLLEAGDVIVIPTPTFTIMLIVRTRTEYLLIYYARIEVTPQIPTADNIAPFYLDISTTNPNAIASATITFNVSKSWVIANDIILSTLVAWRNSDGTWRALSSRLVGEDALYYYLEATTSGFSLFGVTGQKRVIAPIETPTTAPAPQTSPSDQQMRQVIFIAALGILIVSAMLLASTLIHHKRKKFF
jgi:hypothetical protein